MENQPTGQTVQRNATQEAQGQVPKTGLLSKLTGLLAKIPATLMNLFGRFFRPSSQLAAMEGVVATSISPGRKRVFFLLAAAFFVTIILLIIVSFLKNYKVKPVNENKEESSSQTTIIERRPSRYATDEAILKMEADTKALEEEINKSDLDEKSLIPPNLNFDVNFKNK